MFKKIQEEKKAKKRDVFMSTWQPGRGWHATIWPSATFRLDTRAQELAPTGAKSLQGGALPLPLALSIPWASPDPGVPSIPRAGAQYHSQARGC